MRANQNNLGRAILQTKGCRGCEPVACRDILETHLAIIIGSTLILILISALTLDEYRVYTIRTTGIAHVTAITIFQVRQQKF